MAFPFGHKTAKRAAQRKPRLPHGNDHGPSKQRRANEQRKHATGSDLIGQAEGRQHRDQCVGYLELDNSLSDVLKGKTQPSCRDVLLTLTVRNIALLVCAALFLQIFRQYPADHILQ